MHLKKKAEMSKNKVDIFKIKIDLWRARVYDCLNKMPSVDELVKLYVRISFSNKDMISLLTHTEVVSILRQDCVESFCLFRMKNHTVTEEMAEYAQAQIERL